MKNDAVVAKSVVDKHGFFLADGSKFFRIVGNYVQFKDNTGKLSAVRRGTPYVNVLIDEVIDALEQAKNDR